MDRWDEQSSHLCGTSHSRVEAGREFCEYRSMARSGTKTMLTPGAVFATAAHDLKNPLSGILSAAEYLMEDAAPLLEGEHVAMLHLIELSSRHLLALIDDLAEISSIAPGGLRRDTTPRDLVRLIRGVVTRSQALLASKKIRVDLATEAERPHAVVDSRKLQHAMHRLLGLAVRDLPEGSRIVIRVATVKRKAVISVPFRGAAVGPGDRLSMHLVEQIAAGHGGAFRAAAASGGGVVFHLTLPLSVRSRR
jgi:signal transduction histidine kinase